MAGTSSFKESTQTEEPGSDNAKRAKTLGFALLITLIGVGGWYFFGQSDPQKIETAPLKSNAATKSEAPASGTAAPTHAASVATESPPEIPEAPTIPVPDVAVTSTTPTTATSPLAASASETVATAPLVKPRVARSISFGQPAALVAPTSADEPTIANVDSSAIEPIVKPIVEEEMLDRWQKLRADNPGTTLPSADMWKFQTRKLKSQIYLVKKNESLKSISQRLLSSDRFWLKLWSLNPNLTDPESIPVGTKLLLHPDARGTASHQ